MSRLLAVVLILLVPAMAWTIPVWPPMDTPTFVAKSNDILIVRCINADVLGGGKDDGLTLVEVEVLVVVKGDRKAGQDPAGHHRTADGGWQALHDGQLRGQRL